MIKRINCLLGLMLFICFGGFAQKQLSLDEAIATALQNNYNIQLSRNDSLVAALDYSYRNYVFYPTLNANIGTSWTSNDQKQNFSDGTKRERNGVKSSNINASLGLNWTLFDGLRMFATREKAAELVKLGELEIKQQLINTVAAVIGTYYSIVRQKQQLKAIEEQMSISQVRVDLAQRKLDIGLGTRPDLLQSQVDLNAQKAARLNQETLIAQLREQLNQRMGVSISTQYDVADSIPFRHDITLGEVQAQMTASNPDLQIGQKNIDIAGFSIKERKAERWPTLSFNSAYNFSRADNKAVVNPFQPLFSRNKGYNYGLTASIPIFNGLNSKRLIQQAELDKQYMQLQYKSIQSQLDLQVMNAYKDYEQQQKALELEESNIALARENVQIILETYRLGQATFLQLREAQKSLEDGYNRLIAARYNTKLAETELLRLKGDLIK